jgi:FkbM family methyltransferase|tara:strand:- start:330 stop:1079 length:750 start_codon:yes stop_codon:yes gene_type:complete
MSDYKILFEILCLEKANIRNTIVEVGSHDCTDAIYLCKKFPESNVISFECLPSAIEKCEANIASSGLQDRIKLIKCAAGSVEGPTKFYPYMAEDEDENTGAASSVYVHVDNKNTQSITVQMRRIENVLKENKIRTVDLLCIDAQGSELHVLKGMGDMLKDVKYIQTEMPTGVESMYQNAPTKPETLQHLSDFGFKLIYNSSDKQFTQAALIMATRQGDTTIENQHRVKAFLENNVKGESNCIFKNITDN